MIDDLRTEIDEIDERLVELLNRRASTAMEIGQRKKIEGKDITDREREREVIEGVKKKNDGPFSDEQIERIYRTLISETKNIQTEVGANDSSDEAGSN